jgi:uncharacterized protein YggU (UPF0235/DUF167 family)
MAARLAVRLTPRGGRNAIDGWTTDSEGRPLLKVRVSAAPVDGAANAALIAVLSEAVGVPKSRITLTAGAAARIKLVEVAGIEEADLGLRLGRPSGGT